MCQPISLICIIRAQQELTSVQQAGSILHVNEIVIFVVQKQFGVKLHKVLSPIAVNFVFNPTQVERDVTRLFPLL